VVNFIIQNSLSIIRSPAFSSPVFFSQPLLRRSRVKSKPVIKYRLPYTPAGRSIATLIRTKLGAKVTHVSYTPLKHRSYHSSYLIWPHSTFTPGGGECDSVPRGCVRSDKRARPTSFGLSQPRRTGSLHSALAASASMQFRWSEISWNEWYERSWTPRDRSRGTDGERRRDWRQQWDWMAGEEESWMVTTVDHISSWHTVSLRDPAGATQRSRLSPTNHCECTVLLLHHPLCITALYTSQHILRSLLVNGHRQTSSLLNRSTGVRRHTYNNALSNVIYEADLVLFFFQ